MASAKIVLPHKATLTGHGHISLGGHHSTDYRYILPNLYHLKREEQTSLFHPFYSFPWQGSLDTDLGESH